MPLYWAALTMHLHCHCIACHYLFFTNALALCIATALHYMPISFSLSMNCIGLHYQCICNASALLLHYQCTYITNCIVFFTLHFCTRFFGNEWSFGLRLSFRGQGSEIVFLNFSEAFSLPTCSSAIISELKSMQNPFSTLKNFVRKMLSVVKTSGRQKLHIINTTQFGCRGNDIPRKKRGLKRFIENPWNVQSPVFNPINCLAPEFFFFL